MAHRTPATRIEREARTLRSGVSRAFAIGAPAFFLFLGLDLYVRDALYPEADPGRVIAWRSVGALVLATSLIVLRFAGSLRQVVWLTALILSAALVTLGGLAVELGGLESSYIFSIAYFAVGIGTFLPSGWRDMLLLIGLPTVAFIGTIVIGVAHSQHAGQLSDPHALHTFAAHLVLMVGLVGFAVFSGQVHWRARRALDDARRLGRYRLKRLIGEGGMNEVWLARDEALGRDIALKLLRPSQDFDMSRTRRFEREAQATSALTSPHTVRVFDHGNNDDGISWIAMEYLRGFDLDRLVENHGPLAPRRVVHFARQAALSLAEAHDQGLVHRDIKPANLFALNVAGEEDFLKVVDFGIARPTDPSATALTMIGMLVGTPAFMAPELFLGANADPRADVYALGATLYLLLTGEPPLSVTDLNGLLDITRRNAIAPPSTQRPPIGADGDGLEDHVLQALDALVMRCLATEPDKRPANGTELLECLDDLSMPAWTENDAKRWWADLSTAAEADTASHPSTKNAESDRPDARETDVPHRA